MEIRTCEEYVLNRAKELENDVFRLKEQLESKNAEIAELQSVITTYDELFRVHGQKDIFDSSVHASVDVCEAFTKEKPYFDFLVERNGQWLEVHDYRKSKDEETQEDEE
jgi:hypothetical protein